MELIGLANVTSPLRSTPVLPKDERDVAVPINLNTAIEWLQCLNRIKQQIVQSEESLLNAGQYIAKDSLRNTYKEINNLEFALNSLAIAASPKNKVESRK